MHFDIFTLFPEMFQGPFAESILKRAQENWLLKISVHNLRDFTHDKHRVVDDKPYGGGQGMCGPDVHRLQHRLGLHTYLPPGYTPGCFDYRTFQAVMAFQGWAGFTRTGIAGAATQRQLHISRTPWPWTGSRHSVRSTGQDDAERRRRHSHAERGNE